MELKKLPIGIDDFEELIRDNYYFIDNSLLIKELHQNGAKVTLITRPRRFGKTLNLSMIKYFYDLRAAEGIKLFENLAVLGDEKLKQESGQYPVVFFSLKGLKDIDWENTYEGLSLMMQHLYKEYQEIVAILDEGDREYYQKIRLGRASKKELEVSLKYLTEYLEKYYQQKVIVLIDEYDTPIINGYIYKFFEPVINFMRNFLTEALKGNESLKFAVITGITRVSKENIFSGLNNPKIATVMDGAYEDKFGFTEEKTEQMLAYYQLEEKQEEVRAWYNGYQFGKARVYNPWSIINYIADGGRKAKAYWVNTSSDSLIKDLLRLNMAELKESFARLIRGEKIKTSFNDNIDFNILKAQKENIWTLFVQSGYLNVVAVQREVLFHDELGEVIEDQYYLQIPNSEVRSLYLNIFRHWFTESVGNELVMELLQELTTGDLTEFSELFSEMAAKYFSYYDVTESKGEEFYHAFVLGLFVNLIGQYRVESNREIGYGRSDLLLIPRDSSKRGLIMELKKQGAKEKDLQETVASALQQIENRKYRLELEKAGVSEIMELGIGFRGKECIVVFR